MPWSEIEEGSQQSERIPGGQYPALRVLRIITGSKKNGPFVSTSGDKQIMLIWVDDQAREAGVMITLSKKAAWKLKGYLVAMGVDLDAMDRDGVDWNNFADETFASRQLCDRPIPAEVRWDKSTSDNKEYADVIPLRRPAGATVPASADEIPI